MKMNDKTITIINRLKRADSATNQDVLHKTILSDCAWYTTSESTVQGTTVSMGSKFKVLIPKDDKYLPYSEWKKVGNQEGHYTMSETDVIILGEVTEDITVANITKIKQSYQPNVCDVRVVIERDLRNLKGLQYGLLVEGV